MGFGFLAAGSGISGPGIGGDGARWASAAGSARSYAGEGGGSEQFRGARFGEVDLRGARTHNSPDPRWLLIMRDQPGVFASGNSCAAPRDRHWRRTVPDHWPTRTCWRGWRAPRTRCPAVSRTAVLVMARTRRSPYRALLQDNSKPAGDPCRGVADAGAGRLGWARSAGRV